MNFFAKCRDYLLPWRTRIEHRLTTLEHNWRTFMTFVDDLKARVADMEDEVTAAVATVATESAEIKDLTAKLAALADAANDPALKELADRLGAAHDRLKAAVDSTLVSGGTV